MRIEAELYRRTSIVETMGRYSGWIALEVGDRAGADIILIPEVVVPMKNIVERVLKTMEEKGNALIVVSEGFNIDGELTCSEGDIDPYGHQKLGGVGFALQSRLKKEGIISTSMAVSYAHRFGSPTEQDADFAHDLGYKAADVAMQGQYGVVSVLRR